MLTDFLGTPLSLGVIKTWADIILSTLGVIISYLLYRLYKQQKELLAANHKAIVSGKIIESNNVETTIELTNYGNGVAKDLQLITIFHIPEEYSDKYIEMSTYLTQEGKTGTEGAVLQPDQEDEFTCSPKIAVRNTEEEKNWKGEWLISAFDEMKKDNIEDVNYCFVVEYSQFTGESQTVILTPFAANINPQDERYNGYPSNLEIAANNQPEATEVFPERLSEHTHNPNKINKIKIRLNRLKNKATNLLN